MFDTSTGPPARRVVVTFKGTGLDVALGLLRLPLESHGVNQLAREIGRSPGRVSEILTVLRERGTDRVGQSSGHPRAVLGRCRRVEASLDTDALSIAPRPARALPPDRYLGCPCPRRPSGRRRAAGTWPRLYVADDVDHATVVGAYGATSEWTGSEVAVCPSRYGFIWQSSAHRDGYPVANQLVVALDLAQDRARGHEVLEVWDPKELTRVR